MTTIRDLWDEFYNMPFDCTCGADLVLETHSGDCQFIRFLDAKAEIEKAIGRKPVPVGQFVGMLWEAEARLSRLDPPLDGQAVTISRETFLDLGGNPEDWDKIPEVIP